MLRVDNDLLMLYLLLGKYLFSHYGNSVIMELFDYQRDGVEFLKANQHAMLFDEPGLGKSAQACVAWKELGLKRVLVICPASVKSVWKNEVVKWGAQPKWDGTKSRLEIVSYEGAVKNSGMLSISQFDLVVIDEAHYLKSKKAKRTKAILGDIVPNCERAWFLTGTPVPNNPSEIWPLLFHVFPDLILGANKRPMDYWAFVRKYCTVKNNGFGEQITGGKNLSDLANRWKTKVLRRKADKNDKMGFFKLPVEGNLSAIPKEDREAIQEALDHPTDPMGALRRSDAAAVTVRRLTGLAKVDGVIKWCRDNLDNYGKIVVFAHHRDVIAKLEAGLPGAVSLHGGTSPADKERAINSFQNGNAPYFIGQLQAAGVGITLTAAHCMVVVELSWVPSDNEQVVKRIDRIGQTKRCVGYFPTIPDSIDENIVDAVMRKKKVQKGLGL